LLRIEDLDLPRVQPGATAQILECLEACGLDWDGPLVFQSVRGEAYETALTQLIRDGLVYPCTCSRRDLSESQPGVDGPVYPGNCRHNPPHAPQRFASRLRVPHTDIGFVDHLQGDYRQDLASDVGDFVLKRIDGLFAYQLAVVVDDAWQGITEVVRGADLLASTPRQICLQRLLGYPQPDYLHLPLLVDAMGSKLSKQQSSDPVVACRPAESLVLCLELLGQSPPAGLAELRPADILDWAISHWHVSGIPAVTRVTAPAMA
jgi:glutamyl-Q tRNA(Asp) synthetase